MKLSMCLLLAVVATASADQGFYQPQQAVQSAPSSYSSYATENYYDNRPPAKQG